MALNKSKGNMYAFITCTLNYIIGICWHNCVYCFMHFLNPNAKPIRLNEKEFKTDLGSGNFIFVGSSTDMWAKDVPSEWILRILDRCAEFPNNRYLFQSKDPARFLEFVGHPVYNQSVFCTTIETNRWYPGIMNNAPAPADRALAMQKLSRLGYETYVTTEPIIQFDLKPMVDMIRMCNPTQVNIGRDSKHCGLPEPTEAEVQALAAELRKFTTVHVKSNVKDWTI